MTAKIVPKLLPISVVAVTIAAAISATIIPYSMAVTLLSGARHLRALHRQDRHQLMNTMLYVNQLARRHDGRPKIARR